jgi:hypothetical protein
MNTSITANMVSSYSVDGVSSNSGILDPDLLVLKKKYKSFQPHKMKVTSFKD